MNGVDYFKNFLGERERVDEPNKKKEAATKTNEESGEDVT